MVTARLLLLDRGNLRGVVFVVDLADDLLEDVLDGQQSGDAAVFVHDDGDVIAAATKFLQQRVQPLALGNEGGGPDVAGNGKLLRPGVSTKCRSTSLASNIPTTSSRSSPITGKRE